MSVVTQNIYFDNNGFASKEELLSFLVVADDDRLAEHAPLALEYIRAARNFLKLAEENIEALDNG